MKKVIYLFVLCMVLGLAGCGQSQENKESSTESTSVQVENKNVSDIVSNEHLTNNDTANFQMPEEGYYSNDFDEILNITKEDDGTYRIEYSVICFMSKTRLELTILKQGFLALAAKTTEEMI